MSPITWKKIRQFVLYTYKTLFFNEIENRLNYNQKAPTAIEFVNNRNFIKRRLLYSYKHCKQHIAFYNTNVPYLRTYMNIHYTYGKIQPISKPKFSSHLMKTVCLYTSKEKQHASLGAIYFSS